MRSSLLVLCLPLVACSGSGSIVGNGRPDATTADVTTIDIGTGTDAGTGMDVAPDAPTSVTATIGPAGGTVTLNPGGGADLVTLTFPPGAVRTATPITISLSSQPVPGSFTAVSGMYQFGPSGLQLGTPARVSFQPARPADLAQMDILWSPTGTGGFVSVGGRAATNLITADIRHFSFGFVGRLTEDSGVTPCEEGFQRCGAACVDTSFDEARCGSCEEGCAAGDLCFDGRCYTEVCDTDLRDCDGNPANGCEVDDRVDPMNCGGCGIRCDGGQCVEGVCGT